MVHNKLAGTMSAAASFPQTQRQYDILPLYEGERLSEYQEKVLRIVDEIR